VSWLPYRSAPTTPRIGALFFSPGQARGIALGSGVAEVAIRSLKKNLDYTHWPFVLNLLGCHTIPLRSSSRGYFVPRQTIPSFHRVRIIERNSV